MLRKLFAACVVCFLVTSCVGPTQSRMDSANSSRAQATKLAEQAETTRSAQIWLRAAQAWLKVPDYDRAEESVLGALRLKSDDQQLKSVVLEAAKISGLRAPPDVMWSFRNESDFTIARFWSIRGRHLFAQKKFNSAATDLTRALTLNPINSADWAFLARAHAEKERPVEAAQAGLRAISLVIKRGALTPRKRWAMFQFVVVQAKRAKRFDLMADAGFAWLEQPGSPDLPSFLRSVRWPPKVRLLMFQKQIRRQPKDNAARLALGRLLYEAEEYSEAATTLRTMPRRTSRWSRAYEIGAEAAHRAGRHGLAIWMHAQLKDDARWSRYATTDRRTPSHRYRVIHALMRAKRYAWARSEAHLDLFLRPNDTKLLYLYALATSLSVGEREGYEAMLKVLDINPKHVAALNFVGYSLVAWNEDLPKAETLLNLAIAAEPNNPSIMDSMAWLHYRNGRFNEALNLLKRALISLPTSGTVMFHLACVLRKLGKIEESETLYRQALEQEDDPQERARFGPEWSKIQ